GTFDIISHAACLGGADLSATIRSCYSINKATGKKADSNFTNFRNSEFDKVLDRFSVEVDLQRKIQLGRQLNQILNAEVPATAMRLLPGDPLVAVFGLEGARRLTPAQRANLEEALGLRDPLVVQYGKWLRDIGTGQFGKSLLRGDSVTQFVLRRGPITLEIAMLATVISWVVGFPVGIVSAVRPRSWLDHAGVTFSTLFVAIPGFWLGLVAVLALILWFDYKAPIL